MQSPCKRGRHLFWEGKSKDCFPVDSKLSIQNLEGHLSYGVAVVHIDVVETVPGTISNCEEIKALVILEGRKNQNIHESDGDALIGKNDVNTLLASGEGCSLIVKEKQSCIRCIRDEAEGSAQEKLYNLSQAYVEKHNDNNMQGITALESLSGCFIETGENVESPNRNKVQACEGEVCFIDAQSKYKGMDASNMNILQCCASSSGNASDNISLSLNAMTTQYWPQGKLIILERRSSLL